jgi:hypothetical protein
MAGRDAQFWQTDSTVRFFFGIHDHAGNAAGQFAVFDFQHIGMMEVRFKRSLTRSVKKVKPPEPAAFSDRRLARRRSGVLRRAKVAGVLHTHVAGRWHPSLSVARRGVSGFPKIQFTAHCGFGDFRHLRFKPCMSAISSMHSMVISVESISIATNLNLQAALFRQRGEIQLLRFRHGAPCSSLFVAGAGVQTHGGIMQVQAGTGLRRDFVRAGQLRLQQCLRAVQGQELRGIHISAMLSSFV